MIEPRDNCQRCGEEERLGQPHYLCSINVGSYDRKVRLCEACRVVLKVAVQKALKEIPEE